LIALKNALRQSNEGRCSSLHIQVYEMLTQVEE
jgi:hypothetical protein